MTATRGKAALGLLALFGVFAFLAASGDKAHAKPRGLPPEPDEPDEPLEPLEPPVQGVPMPPPPIPGDSDAVIVETPGAEPAEVPIGDALIGDITYDSPGETWTAPVPDGGGGVIVEAPGAEPAEVPIEVLPAEEDDEDVIAPQTEAPADDFPEPDMQTAEAPTTLPADTASILAIMLADERGKNWKRKLPELIPWQRARGLTADGEFGPKSASRMAEETGLLPIVRFWPKNSFKEGKWLPDYIHGIRVQAVTAPEPRASQLVAAAQRETGQGFGRGQQAISPTIAI